MPTESFGSNFEHEKVAPKPQASLEEIQKVEKDIEYSKQLTKVNDVLNVLDLPDDKEEIYRITLEKQDPQILKELVKKSKNEILTFVLKNENSEILEVVEKKQTEIKIQDKETEKRWIENERIDKKFLKIKSVFTPAILDKNPKIAEQLNLFDSKSEALEKDIVLQKILELLKEPWKLKSITDSLGWVNKNNPKYVEFKNTLISLDPSFETYFNDLENINEWIYASTNEVVNSIENNSEWLIKIDLNSDTPNSKMSLPWSQYNFVEQIDKQALTDIQEENINILTGIQNSYAVLKGLYNPFNKFINQIKQNWNPQDLKQTTQSAISNFSNDIFNGLDEHYGTMGIKSNMQLTQSDVSSFAQIDSPNDLKLKIDNIKEKFTKIETQAWKVEALAYKDYKTQLKEFLEMESEQEEKQKKVLEFLKKSGFDLIPKEITDKLIKELQSNTLTIPWLDLSVKNIDIKNWNFWESGAFIDKEAWINIASKTNMVKFMNKIISWNIDEPLSVQAIVNWGSVVDPAFLKNKFLEADVVGGMGWKYGRIVENLRKVS